MFKTLPLPDAIEVLELEYYNPVGLLYKNHFFLHGENKILKFDIQEIKRLFFKKERNLKLNYVLLTVGCVLLALSLFFRDTIVSFRLLGFTIAGIIILFAMIKKTYQYKIILFTNNSNYFTVPVNEAYKDDACELLSRTKTKMKKNKFYLKAI